MEGSTLSCAKNILSLIQVLFVCGLAMPRNGTLGNQGQTLAMKRGHELMSVLAVKLSYPDSVLDRSCTPGSMKFVAIANDG